MNTLLTEPGLDAAKQLASTQEGYLKTFLMAGVDPCGMPEADSAPHVLRKSSIARVLTCTNTVTEVTDVIFPACLMKE